MISRGESNVEVARALVFIRSVCASLVVAFLATGPAHARTWGAQPFDNDIAVNWLNELKLTGADSILAAFRRVNQEKAMVQADACTAAIAAAAIVAAARDGGSTLLPGEAVAWLQKTQFKPNDELATEAHSAVTTCRRAARSELYMRWMAMQDAPTWLDSVKELLKRLEPAR
jgi:hypothetical protein